MNIINYFSVIPLYFYYIFNARIRQWYKYSQNPLKNWLMHYKSNGHQSIIAADVTKQKISKSLDLWSQMIVLGPGHFLPSALEWCSVVTWTSSSAPAFYQEKKLERLKKYRCREESYFLTSLASTDLNEPAVRHLSPRENSAREENTIFCFALLR